MHRYRQTDYGPEWCLHMEPSGTFLLFRIAPSISFMDLHDVDTAWSLGCGLIALGRALCRLILSLRGCDIS